MEIADDRPVMVMLVDDDCRECEFMRRMVEDLQRENESVRLDVQMYDVWEHPQVIVDLEALSHPTLILFTDAIERVRISGSTTKRRFLRKVLPYIHPDHDVALAELRRLLDNPGERFPPGFQPRRTDRRVDTVALLRDIPMFAGLSKRQLAMVGRYTDETNGVAGQALAVEGEKGERLFLICEGSAVVKKSGQEIARMGPGACFGEMALIDGGPRSATVELLEDSQLLVIDRRDFEFMMDRMPEMAREMLVVVSQRLRDADEKLVS